MSKPAQNIAKCGGACNLGKRTAHACFTIFILR